ncbi:MAG: hypothetical protein ABR529_05350 [Actinomycetota bacterium]
MADPSGSGAEPPARPGWVKVFGIIAIIVVVVVIVMLLIGGGHGPGRHLSGAENPAGNTPPVEHGG